MTHTKDEILNALDIIKDTCDDFFATKGKGCFDCPFGDDMGHCSINEQTPFSWELSPYKIWRAIE